MRIHSPDETEDLAPNLTPMVDVTFLLLTFFLLATTFLDPEKEINIELPVAQSGSEAGEIPKEIIINVLRDGEISLSGQIVDEEGLLRTLRQTAASAPDTQVTIRGDREVAHQSIVRVMDACGVAGLGKLAVGTLEEG